MEANRPAVLYDATGRRRSPITLPEYRRGQRPANYGKRFPGEVYEPAEVLQLLSAIPSTSTGIRDRALLALLWRTGLRIHEALNLREIDLHESTGYVRVRRSKARRGRDVAVFGSSESSTWGWDQLRPWLERRESLGIDRAAPLFCVVQGPTRSRRVLESHIRTALKRYADAAELRGRVHLHGFRHTLSAELFRGGVSLVFLQRQLGHSSLAVTQQYLESIGAADVMDALAAYQPTWTSKAA